MLNDVTPIVEKEKQSLLKDTTDLGSFPPLPTQVNTLAGNAPGKSSYANTVGKKVAYLVVDGLDAMLENGLWDCSLNQGVEKTMNSVGPCSLAGKFDQVDNDVEFCTNVGTSNLGNNNATPSGSSFMNIDNDVEFASNTSIVEKIDKIE
nr:hypothetical protein [Tanacetum cinerariifolium]